MDSEERMIAAHNLYTKIYSHMHGNSMEVCFDAISAVIADFLIDDSDDVRQMALDLVKTKVGIFLGMHDARDNDNKKL